MSERGTSMERKFRHDCNMAVLKAVLKCLLFAVLLMAGTMAAMASFA